MIKQQEGHGNVIQVTFRHLNTLPMKYELLREIKHWKNACKTCVSDVTSNIRSLRESRAEVKREINATRAELEKRLKELEEVSEKQMFDMVAKEEETLKNFTKQLADRERRLTITESQLKENIIGFKLKRTLEDGKHQALALRETMLEVRKYNMATGVVFKLKEQLNSITDSLDSLGTVNLVARSTPGHQQILKEQSQKSDNSNTMMSSKESLTSLETLRESGLLTNGSIRSDSIENTMINDIDFFLEMETKYGHSLKPFLDSVKDISLKYKSHDLLQKERTSSKKIQTNPKIVDCVQTPKSALRSQSASNRDKDGPNIHTRLSKSAREDGRSLGTTNFCLNGVDMSYVPFEEQGPESKEERKKRTLSVRYHDFDFVKEITAVKDEVVEVKEDRTAAANSSITSNGVVKERVRLQSPGSQSTASTSISSVNYKPSSSLASGPVYITPSELRKSNSYFRYKARFHTKKHPDETDLCRLTSIVALDNGQIVVADINHLQIMLFGPDFTYLDALECPSPCGLCQVSENSVAVTLFHNRKFMQVKVSTIHLIRYKDINVQCQETLFAVSYHNGSYFVLCFAGDIHILDDEGRQLGVLKTGINAGEARHLDVDEETKMIFVSGHDRVSCFNDAGEKLWQYSCSTYHRRFTPTGIVLYNKRLFVTDWSGHKVLELSLDGSRVRDVVTDNVEYPYALAVQKSYGRMFITQSNFFKQEARSRSVKVFEIK